MFKRSIQIIVGCFTLPLIAMVCQAAQPLQPLDLFELSFASSPEISPDARQVVYARHFNDVMTDMGFMNLWITNSDGTENRPITTGKGYAYNAKWSPDGTHLAYISTQAGMPQIYVRNMATGESRAITNLTQRPGSVTWSPDGSKIAFSMLVPGAPLVIGKMPEPPEGAQWAPPAKMTDQIIFRFDGVGDLPAGYTHLFTVSADGGEPKQVTHGDYNHGGMLAYPAIYSWAPDGNSLIVTANRRDDWQYEIMNVDLFEFSLDGGEPVILSNHAGPEIGAVVSPDGQHIAYIGYEDRRQSFEMMSLYVADRDGSHRRVIEDSAGRHIPLGNIAWTDDSQSVYSMYVEEGIVRLARFGLEGGFEVLAENLGLGIAAGAFGGTFSVSRDGTYAITVKTPHTPGDVAVGHDGKLKQLTDLNQDLLSQRTLGEVEELWWESSKDGRKIQGWMIKPPGFEPGRKYPLILSIHGGPFDSDGPLFDAEKQLMAAAGYVVLYVNYRGSSGYGEEFGSLVHHAYPGDEFYDLNSGVDAVIEKGFIDQNRLYVTGGSAGGLLTAWMTAHTNRFRAAAALYPVINFEGNVLEADLGPKFLNRLVPGLPWDHAEWYAQHSMLNASTRVKTPTLIMTGEEDLRTPMSQSEQYYKALKFLGVDAVLVRVPGAGHGITGRPSWAISTVATVLGWFDIYSTQ